MTLAREQEVWVLVSWQLPTLSKCSEEPNNKKGTEHCEDTTPSTSITHPMIKCFEDLRVCFVLSLQHVCFSQLFTSELKRHCIISVYKGNLNPVAQVPC